MPSAHLTLREEDVVRLTLEFLHNRDLHISQLSVERETGVINGNYSDDVLFLRQLILDGQWDDVLEFIQPLEALQSFDMRKFCYIIMTHKYIELLCIKSEAGLQGSNVDNAVEEVVRVLNDLEKYAPSKEDYSNLCLLLTLPRLNDHALYKDWNPSNARVKCFREVFPLVEPFLSSDRKTIDHAMGTNTVTTAKNDRLIQLIIKGILYESCVNYCQTKATGSKESQNHEMTFSRLLDGSVGFSDSDLSLLSWLQSIPSETFSVPFEQRTLNVDVERLERPSLETSWTEHMLVTPIKPKTFPHSAMPFTRPRSAADVMSRSLHPAFDGLSSGLGGGVGTGSPAHHVTNPRLMALSTGDINTSSPMSRSSFASFHLSSGGGQVKNSKLMNTSVDRLFENENEVFLSSSYVDFQQQLPSIIEHVPGGSVRSKSRSPDAKTTSKSPSSTPEHQKQSTPVVQPRVGGRESPGSTSTNRSSRRDSLTDKTAAMTVACTSNNNSLKSTTEPTMETSYCGDLLKEYQRQKQRIQEQTTAREKEREELIRQQMNNHHDNRLIDESLKHNKPAVNGGIPPQSQQFINNNVLHHSLSSQQQQLHQRAAAGDVSHTIYYQQPQQQSQNATIVPQQQQNGNIKQPIVHHVEKIPPDAHYDTVKDLL